MDTKKWILVIILILLLGGAGALVYFYFKSQQSSGGGNGTSYSDEPDETDDSEGNNAKRYRYILHYKIKSEENEKEDRVYFPTSPPYKIVLPVIQFSYLANVYRINFALSFTLQGSRLLVDGDIHTTHISKTVPISANTITGTVIVAYLLAIPVQVGYSIFTEVERVEV